MTSLYDGICMSCTKNNGNRCKCKVLKNGDFCRIHDKNKKYSDDTLNDVKDNITVADRNNLTEKYLDCVLLEFDNLIKTKTDELNNNFQFSLLGMNDNWTEVPFIYWYFLDDSWWDIRTLISTITSQINQTELENPFPIYPENPFTRNKISISCLKLLLKEINILQLHIHISLMTFLNFDDKILNELYEENDQRNITDKVVSIFSKTLRFKMINYRDSQGRFCGYWVDKGTPISFFEETYREIIKNVVYLDNNFTILTVGNDQIKLYDLLKNLPKENYEF